MLNAERIRERILGALPGAEVQVRDTTGTGDHFEAAVVSPAFTGKPMVQQHKLDVHQPAPIPAWQSPQDPRHAITLDHLLRQASGLDLDYDTLGFDRNPTACAARCRTARPMPPTIRACWRGCM